MGIKPVEENPDWATFFAFIKTLETGKAATVKKPRAKGKLSND